MRDSKSKSTITPTSIPHRRRPVIDPWSMHNLRLIHAACKVSLMKSGLHVEQGFNYGQKRRKKRTS
jgi:hypothetical protein